MTVMTPDYGHACHPIGPSESANPSAWLYFRSKQKHVALAPYKKEILEMRKNLRGWQIRVSQRKLSMAYRSLNRYYLNVVYD
jgi:hypothetical protein